MKKILVCLCYLAGASVLAAQIYPPRRDALFKGRLTNTVLRRQQQTWQDQLARMQIRFRQLPRPITDREPLSPRFCTVLSPHAQQTYFKRLQHVQKQMQYHPALHRYTFEAANPADLANLSVDHYYALVAFASNQTTVRVTRTEWVRPFTLALHLEGLSHARLELWIDEPTKKIYLMSNNFYTSVSGKYADRLK